MIQTTLRLSTEEMIKLWEGDPRYKENKELREKSDLSGFMSESSRKYSSWNPIPKRSNAELAELKKRFHPVICKGAELFKINDFAMGIFSEFLNWPVTEDKLNHVNFVGHFITLHENCSLLYFRPTVSEVLSQLPKGIAELSGNFFYSTDTISNHAYECSTGSSRVFHVAVTTLFKEC